jgi:hypothetical protein
MPAGDRTGPYGGGPMTGRGAGYCAGFGIPGYANPIYGRRHAGRGFGRGFGGGGHGWRHWYWATGLPGWARGGYYGPLAGASGAGWMGFPPAAYDRKEEIEFLKEQAKYFGEAITDINRRIDELQSAEHDKSRKEQ